MKERHPSSWHNMIFFHDQDDLFDNDKSATCKAGHIRLKHSQEIESLVHSFQPDERMQGGSKETNLCIQEATFFCKKQQA